MPPININKPETFTIDAVSELIASKDDVKPCQIRVGEDGAVYLSDVNENLHLKGVRFALSIWFEGNDYFGKDAAGNSDHVQSVYDTILHHWVVGTRGVTDEMV